MQLKTSCAVVALLALLGCRTPGEFETSFEMARAQNAEGFDRLVRCLGLDPESEGHVGGPLTYEEAQAFRTVFEKVNRGTALAEKDFDGVPCQAVRTDTAARENGSG